ncbi:ATP-binding protein [Pinirhizobacter soli]|uniref:ATP-binding protein n=1 Tax=Pinirhizobacter soli TaxID=2786953 RepID=UPI00202A4C4F|nr:ATP-binding protein [Pinirhizobacter soli]
MFEAVAFKTRARTIDHLGREQIADCPTAISELWKNAYDAYATSVALHIFDGKYPVAALVDNGHGMSKRDFVEKWLVIGTESKLAPSLDLIADRGGIPERERQGQKGIGRLSAAALGPYLLVVSKKKDENFVASLIDWRIFENPFLYLQDIEIPVMEFPVRDELESAISEMANGLLGNVWGDGADVSRDSRLAASWKQFDDLCESEGKPSVRQMIEHAVVETPFSLRHLQQWDVWKGDAEAGTALLVGDIGFDLLAQLPNGVDAVDEQAASQARSRLFETLTNFTDPFVSSSETSDEWAALDFDYGVTVWEGALSREIISRERNFTYSQLQDLEHVIIGQFDDVGVFRGRVKVFGKWIDNDVEIPPRAPTPARVDTRVGSFKIRVGTFEQVLRNSTHPPEIFSALEAQAKRYGGFMVFRNGLRVMPYGREGNDFFEIERRRTLHAGREFWSLRRIFGSVALTRKGNPNLKDKAGREGIIDNKAAKIFRDLVEDLLSTTARRYFGTDSPVRKSTLPEINLSNEQRKADEARNKLRKKLRREFRRNLSENHPKLKELTADLEALADRAREGELPTSETELLELRTDLSWLKQKRASLTLGQAPTKLGPLEPVYLEFRALNQKSSDLITQLSDSLSAALGNVRPQSQRDLVVAEIARNAVYLQTRLRKWSTEVKTILGSESARTSEFVSVRNKKYHAETLSIVSELERGDKQIGEVLQFLDEEKVRQDAVNSEFFVPYISTLQNLSESIDIEAIVSSLVESSGGLSIEIDRLNSLAQLGITVEIVGHEMEGLDSSITRSLRALPDDVKLLPAYKTARSAHEALSSRLRFLSPLRLSGEHPREKITGQEVFDYCQEFLNAVIAAGKISFSASLAFREFEVEEQTSRIMPVFVNLVNNAVYWVGHNPDTNRIVTLDVRESEVLVSDNGPGVAKDDIPSLFSLFFTRKSRGGRGVGLYLSRANLAASGHVIRYVTDEASKLLPGANFAIKFRGN